MNKNKFAINCFKLFSKHSKYGDNKVVRALIIKKSFYDLIKACILIFEYKACVIVRKLK